jgi:hypothetical protein
MSSSSSKFPMRAKLLAAGFLFAAWLAASVSAAGLNFVRVWPRWRDADFFTRISEYLGGPENPSHRIILRTHPELRPGCYFEVRVKNDGARSDGAKFVLHIIAPDSPEAKIFTFPAEVPSGQPVYEIGLTGYDWPSRKVLPVAWQLELFSADGKTLATAHSFLWSK